MHSTDNGNKHIQGAEFWVTYLRKENALFSPPTVTVKRGGLMARSSCTFEYATTQTRTQSLLQHRSQGGIGHYEQE